MTSTPSSSTTEGDTTEPTEAPARITKFIPKPRKVGTGFVTKPGRNAEDRPTPRERRPFTRESNRPDRPSFTKPWEEEKADRLAAAQSPSNRSRRRPPQPRGRSPLAPLTANPASTAKGSAHPSAPSPPSAPNQLRHQAILRQQAPLQRRPSPFKSDRPTFRRSEGSTDSRPPRREYTPRPYSDAGSDSTDRPRKTFSKPGTFGRKREGFTGKPSFGRDSNDARPPRRDYGDSRPPRREFTPRPDRDSSDSRPPRRTFGDKPASHPSADLANPAASPLARSAASMARPHQRLRSSQALLARQRQPQRR